MAAAVSVITRSEIRAFGWRTLDQALASLPGVYVTYDRQYTYLGTRGFGVPGDYNTRLLVTVNGNRLNDPVYDAGPFGNQLPLDLDLVERIEFLPGPGGAVYGQNAMLGVVNLVTRDGAAMAGSELSLAYQHPQAQREGRASWGRRFESGLDVLLSASASRSRGEDRFYTFGSSETTGVAAGLDGDRDEELYARAAQGPWTFDLLYGKRVKDDPTGVYFSDPLVAGQYQGDAYKIGQLQFEDRFAQDSLRLLGRLFAGQERYLSRLSYGTPFDFTAAGNWHGTEWRLLSTAFENHKLMIGFEAQKNTRQDQDALDAAAPENDISITKSGYRIGVFAQDEWRLSPTLAATLGLRLDRDDTSKLRSSPRAALIWQAAEATTVKALYGRAHRSPNAYESDYDDGFAQLGNPSLRGERVDTLEFVADHRIGPDLGLRAALYQWTMHDLITLGIEASGLAQYQSGDRIEARGLELAADRTWRGGARLRGSASLQDVGYASGGALLNSPKALGRINFSAPLPWAGLRLGYEWRYDSRRLSVDGSWLGGYALSNLHLSSDALAPGLELSLTIGNLFDKRYAQPGADTNWQNALDQDGRSLRAHIAYRF